MRKSFLKLTALVLALLMATSVFVSCKDTTDTDGDTPNGDERELLDISGFTIVRAGVSGRDVANITGKLKQAIQDTIGLDLAVTIDDDSEASAKEILIGKTNRQASTSAFDYLKDKNDKDSYVIRISKNQIIITGTDDASTARAVKVFIDSYVRISPKGNGLDVSAGAQMSGIYDSDYITKLENGTEISVDFVSPVIERNKQFILPDGSKFVPKSGSYPSITELRYQKNEADNGKLIATFAVNVMVGDSSTASCVMMSENQGRSWKCIARPNEKIAPNLGSVGSMAHIYELPAQVGEMPAGTLLYSYNAVNYDRPDGKNGRSILAVWRSFDAGYTWEEYVIIDEAKGLTLGIWEPFMIYCEEDGYLYCFYSDDSDPDHDQKISYKRSKDGVNWEGEGGKIGSGTGKDVEPVDVVANNDYSYRPGMPVITKMGNGEYFICYEQFGDWYGCPIFYKTTKDLSDWGDVSTTGTLIKSGNKSGSSSPACLWTPAGGECGTLFVTSKYSSSQGYILVSTDYGKTWTTIEDPLESDPIKNDGSDRVGYSAGLWLGADGKTVYYINSDNSAQDSGTQVIYMAKLTVYDPIDE